MKISIVIAILDSPEIVRRQLLHYGKTNLPKDVEVVFVDDGSIPPLKSIISTKQQFNFSLYETKNYNDWTQPAARNFGARKAKGEYCIFTDIDHIINKNVIDYVKNHNVDVIRFKREIAILDENGNFVQDRKVLKDWGYKKRSLRINAHSNSYIIKRDLFLRVGGSSERYVNTGHYPNQEELPLKGKLHRLRKQGKIKIIDDHSKPTIYMFPVGRHCGERNWNPFGLFHNLKRESKIELHA